ncbi:hypothetical protein INT48_009120 [Thamnidium elegans]|uniref:Uncharacterized protein n=1 Tax=Thamnidium elegans TaxID=101142 RepID=A0A8H7SSU2_9FUNG|nr:hypothetical protein INT48_009120 [Thamnidium elegans]
MVDRVSQIPFSPLRTTSIGFIDDYESASHRRMSSGNSSTDSNATIPHVSTKRHHVIPRTEFTSPLYKNIQNTSVSARLSKKEDLPTPSSGYDGDTEEETGIIKQ